MFLHKELEILVVAANAAAFVHLEFFLLFPRAQAFLPWKIAVADVEESGVHVGVKSFFTAHDLFPVVNENLVKRLPTEDER